MYFACLSDGDVPLFELSFPSFFLAPIISKEGNFSKVSCQNMSKGDILLDRVIIRSNFHVF